MSTMMKYLEQRQEELNGKVSKQEDNTTSGTPSQSPQRSNASPTIAYKLFVYREELRNPQARHLKLSKSKLNLTQELVSYSVDRITEYGMDDLMIINRQILFTRKLKNHMDCMKQMQKIRSSSQSPSPQKMKSRASG